MIITIQKKKEKKETATGTAQNLQTKSSLNGYLNKPFSQLYSPSTGSEMIILKLFSSQIFVW